ncbi:DUF3566 domain-containing protein [Glycomyces algeriensis]|uniref:DUF3566 domain-containing protein n=1 Tax=Glycomyces algeriensis TaxID=256037 RepID=A0A9W6G690_9ACTN|nr:DUF3566 domain-containing protein [Glycomyces algeriensis]MDA1367254.1 DUF3566 domain-containing protein [Glycomyces algeriensis]MDR7353362.1 hypothetical protein [Glycomyces algeriensis]GLI41058.1 hypothetical protein GALLR39Z86_09080 [Glycomyces algeriensis]
MTEAKATAAETERDADVPEFVSDPPAPAEQATSEDSASSAPAESSVALQSAPAQDQTLTLRRPPGMTPPPMSPDSIPSSPTGNTAANQAAGVASSARVADAVRAARAAVSQAAARGPRRARLRLKRVDPWSVMKFSFAVSIVLFIVMVVATTVLYIALDAMGVFDTVNDMLQMLMGTTADEAAGGTEAFRITAKGVIGAAALLGVVNMVLFTALATLGSFIYNVCADLVGGVEVTLAERD